jgi:hypothetical protein
MTRKTIIPISNGTTSITFACPVLTSLQYDQDYDVWECLYEEWAYGLFAIVLALVALVPIISILLCCIKWRKYQYKKLAENLTRRSSYTEYTDSRAATPNNLLDSNESKSKSRRPSMKSHKTDKIYAYPAYGTHNSMLRDPHYGPDDIDARNQRGKERGLSEIDTDDVRVIENVNTNVEKDYRVKDSDVVPSAVHCLHCGQKRAPLV